MVPVVAENLCHQAISVDDATRRQVSASTIRRILKP